MRGDPQAITTRLPNVVSRRRWSSWIAKAARERRRIKADRVEVIERLAREERQARETGHYVPEPKYRVHVRHL